MIYIVTVDRYDLVAARSIHRIINEDLRTKSVIVDFTDIITQHVDFHGLIVVAVKGYKTLRGNETMQGLIDEASINSPTLVISNKEKNPIFWENRSVQEKDIGEMDDREFHQLCRQFTEKCISPENGELSIGELEYRPIQL